MLSGEDGQNQRCHTLPYLDSMLVVWGHEESRVSCPASSRSVAPTNGKWCNRLISTTSGARGAEDGIRSSSGAVWTRHGQRSTSLIESFANQKSSVPSHDSRM